MRSAGNFHPEWGYLAPAPSFMRTARIALVATAIGGIAGAAVVVSLVEGPGSRDNTAIAAHALLTRAPVIASPALASAADGPAAVKSAPASAQPQAQLSLATAAPSAPAAAAIATPKATTPTATTPKATPSALPSADKLEKADSASPPLPLPAPNAATVAAAAPVSGTARVPAEADEATIASQDTADTASEPRVPAKKSVAKRRRYEPYRRQEAVGPRSRWREDTGFGPLFRLFSFRTGSPYSSN